MSNQTSQKIRRMASPSTGKQGPMKATQSFGLVHGSPTTSRSSNGRKSPSSSPTPVWTSSESHRKNRRSPDLRSSPERCSPSSPCLKGDKSKAALRTGLSPVSHSMKRTNSFETITSAYLGGEWPKDPAPGISEKSTQTPEEWDDCNDKKRKGSHKRSSSVGNGADTLNVKEIKASLAKNRKDGSRGVTSGIPRTSPIQGNHYALSTTPVSLPVKSIPCHVPGKLNRGIRGSVEGLNQEIEKLTLTSYPTGGDVDENIRANAPDGHRAPVSELLYPPSCSVDTQTPSGFAEELRETDTPESNSSSRSQSESPTMPSITGTCNSDKTDGCFEELERYDKEQVSPCPAEKSFSKFVREPPDGCEKVNLKVEEPRREVPPVKDILFCPLKSGFLLIPSQQSAFTPKTCPLLKPYVNQPCDMAIKASKPQDIAPGGSQAAT